MMRVVRVSLPPTRQALLLAVASGFFAVAIALALGAVTPPAISVVWLLAASAGVLRFVRRVRTEAGGVSVPTMFRTLHLAKDQVAEVEVVPFGFMKFRGWMVEIRSANGQSVRAWSTAEEDRQRAVNTQRHLVEGTK